MKLQTEIIINASVEKVWTVLIDFKNYPNWNPFITSIKGEVKVGARLENTIQLKGSKAQVFKPIVLKATTNKEFRWLGQLFIKGLFDGEHYFKLEKIDNNKTKLIHGEHFSGILVSLLMLIIKDQTQQGFESMNQALKEQVEK